MFNSVLHQGIRSKIMALLIKDNEISFKMLKKIINLSDGNLSSHISKLKIADYVKVKKDIINKRPITTIIITSKGKVEFKLYIEELRLFIKESE